VRQLVPRGTPRNSSRRAQEGSFGSERVLFKRRQLWTSVAGQWKPALNECCRKRPVRQLVPTSKGKRWRGTSRNSSRRAQEDSFCPERVFKCKTGLNDCSKCSSSFEGTSIFVLNQSRQKITCVS
jgi:hypothetical protein